MKQRLSAMLEARSIAIVGASARPGSFGERLVVSATSRGFQGRIGFVNRSGGTILGQPVGADISELEQAPDVAVLGVGGPNLEAALIDAIRAGARSAVIFDSCHGECADGTPIVRRLRDIAREAGIPVCGGSGMGFINTHSGAVASFYPADHLKPGGISLIAHSGSVFTVLGMNDPRFRFDLMVSPGQEIGASLDEYIAFAANRPTTKVIAVFMEAARNPVGLVESLELARDRGVPVVICKVGRTEESARLARSHTGAIAGSAAAYAAVFEECGAIAVDTVDELMTTALLCSTGRVPGPGGVGLVTDSGGLREMHVDLATRIGTPLAELSQATKQALRAALPQELESSNPLDCAGALTEDFTIVFDRGIGILAAAPEVSMIGFEADLRDDFSYEEGLLDHARTLATRTDKPCFAYASFGLANNRTIADQLGDVGVPCLNGAEAAMAAVRNLQGWADRRRFQEADDCLLPNINAVSLWRARLSACPQMDEQASLALIADFGVPTVDSVLCQSLDELPAAALTLGYPLVLKTAEPGIDHKSDLGGVILNIQTPEALRAGYEDIAARLGPRAVVQRMAEKGIELAFGCVMDPDFGPLVMVSAGGILIDLFDDRQFHRAPFGPCKAEAMIRRLKVARLIYGIRGDAPRDLRAAAQALADFSVACSALAGYVAEADVNPVLVTETGAVAVDALVVARPAPSSSIAI